MISSSGSGSQKQNPRTTNMFTIIGINPMPMKVMKHRNAQNPGLLFAIDYPPALIIYLPDLGGILASFLVYNYKMKNR